MDNPLETAYTVLYKKHCVYTSRCITYKNLTSSKNSKTKEEVCENGYKNYSLCDMYKKFRRKTK